jgi:hypothetical protein
MYNQLYNFASMVRVQFEDFKRNPAEMIRSLERGDADSAGSTMRTAGIVALILLLFTIVAVAVLVLANQTADKLTEPPIVAP